MISMNDFNFTPTVVNVTLLPENVTVDEGDRNVTFTISRDGDTILNRTVEVQFMTESGSATSGMMFTYPGN